LGGRWGGGWRAYVEAGNRFPEGKTDPLKRRRRRIGGGGLPRSETFDEENFGGG